MLIVKMLIEQTNSRAIRIKLSSKIASIFSRNDRVIPNFKKLRDYSGNVFIQVTHRIFFVKY